MEICCSNADTTATTDNKNTMSTSGEDADQATVDTNTLLPKPTTTPDGKSVEALMQRRLEIDRQLQALENESTSGGSLENNTASKETKVPQSPEYQYPGPLPTTDESVEHSYPQMQAPMHPLDGNVFHAQNAAPNRISSSVSIGSHNSGSNHAPSIKHPSAYPPFANPYDPQFLAAAVTAFHHQQQFQMPMAPKAYKEGQEDSKLWKLICDKEEELKEVRQSLLEMQQKFQEQSLLATKLQTTLDQVKESFEKEKLLIKLQAEKEAQEQMFQKQMLWMEKNMSSKKDTEEPTNVKTTTNEPTKADVRTAQNGDSGTKTSPKKSPDKTKVSSTNNSNAYNGIKSTTSDDNNGKTSSKSIELYPSIDESMGGGNQGNPPSQLPPKPKTPINEAPMRNTMGTTSNSIAASQSSDRFDPVYVTGKEEPMKEPVYNSNDDDGSLGNTVASSTYGDDRIKVTNKKLLDPYGDKGTYTGVVLRNTGMPHGQGRMVYEEDRRVFEGDWRHGRWHGEGRASFSNGDSYEGQYKFDQRHGKGIYRWNDGRVYNGQFSEDKRHGKGVFTWPDGAVYDGDFVNGQRQGHGKYTFADGGQYEGSWKDGRYDGFGTCTWEDGRRYRGEWRNGMAHGRGTETYPNGSIRHEGEWVDDEPIR